MNDDYKDCLGIGVIGNLPGHLEQAGEAHNFKHIAENMPKGVFPFFVPNHEILGRYCIDSKMIALPDYPGAKVQAEAEIGLLCDLEYDEGKVNKITPRYFMALNDTSMRNNPSEKLSGKKNFSPACKAVGRGIELDEFAPGKICDNYSLVSFIKFDGALYHYGPSTRISQYNCFYDDLISWLTTTVNTQKDEGILEDLSPMLRVANYPKRALFAIGATSYCDIGETHFLRDGDIVYIVVYDHTLYSEEDVRFFVSEDVLDRDGISFVSQRVIRESVALESRAAL